MTNRREELYAEWHRLAGDALAAAMDVLRAAEVEHPDTVTLCKIARDAIDRALAAEAQYRKSVDEERRQG